MRTTANYSRFILMFGGPERNGTVRKLHAQMLQNLGKSFHELKADIEKKLARAIKEFEACPLERYREPEQLKQAWGLTSLLPRLPDWDFLACENPEKTGIVCRNAEGRDVLLFQDSFKYFGLLDKLEVPSASELWYALAWWGSTVQCLWSAIIAGKLIRHFRKQRLLPESYAPARDAEPAFRSGSIIAAPAVDPDKPLGELLAFRDITDEEATRFYEFAEKCRFGSSSCEVGAGVFFKNWLRGASIGTLKKYGMTLEAAHCLLLAGSQREPRVEFELRWNQKARAYQLMCVVYGHGGKDTAAVVPEGVLVDIFAGATEATQVDLTRLLVRGGWGRAERLLWDSLDHDD